MSLQQNQSPQNQRQKNNDSVRVSLPEKAKFLLTERARYKVLEGGRDASKSHSIARAALVRGITSPQFPKPTRFLCCRELMTSVEESIYKLLCDQIASMGLTQFYDVKTAHILGRRGTAAWGTQFAFTGLRHNVDEIKSYEGFDVAIVEEAKNVSRSSWDTLVFTIRKEGSEIWVVLNPDLESDETYQRFIVNPPPGAIVEHFTWRDNPWPSKVLEPEREKMRLERPDDYENIWEGRPRNMLADAVYADELRIAERENRITRVAYDPAYPVHTYWDLGYGNHTSIWMLQKIALEWRALRFLQNANKPLAFYVSELQKLSYAWGTDYLPHDGRNRQLAGNSIEMQLKTLGRTVEVLPREDVTTGINAVRSVFPLVYFDREGCYEGLQCLRHYRWKKNEDGMVIAREPLKDEHADAADAFRTFAMARHRRPKGDPSKTRARKASAPAAATHPGAWMGT